jgi:hypothetical protein
MSWTHCDTVARDHWTTDAKSPLRFAGIKFPLIAFRCPLSLEDERRICGKKGEFNLCKVWPLGRSNKLLRGTEDLAKRRRGLVVHCFSMFTEREHGKALNSSAYVG